ncbi:MAG: tyrosine-protein phosphatase, partial [Parasporobacterium sp.]|nr:tyrosine-protein phosphatase [Parasporobacterium sp.]
LLGCAVCADEFETIAVEDIVVDKIDSPADDAGFSVYDLGDNVDMHTSLQKAVLLDEAEKAVNYALGAEELSRPQGAVIRWTYDNEVPETFTVSISTNEDMSDALTYEVLAEADEYGIYSYAAVNLYLMTKYYYTIAAGDAVSDIYSFTTSADAPRNMFVDGVTNFRDLGGWPMADGGYTRQGMIYRGAKISDDYTGDVLITEAGIDTMLNTMGIKTEIDFREVENGEDGENGENGGITASALGDTVNYVSLPIVFADGYPSPDKEVPQTADAIKETFRLLADESNYPVYFHCSIGTDRTGFFAYLMLSLLDVDTDLILHDFMLSNLGFVEKARQIKTLVNRLNKTVEVMDGGTNYERVVNYLLFVGVPQEDIDSFIASMSK